MEKIFAQHLVTNRCSRQENKFVIPAKETDYGKTAIFYQGNMMWNSLPSEIKISLSAVSFDQLV